MSTHNSKIHKIEVSGAMNIFVSNIYNIKERSILGKGVSGEQDLYNGKNARISVWVFGLCNLYKLYIVLSFLMSTMKKS